MTDEQPKDFLSTSQLQELEEQVARKRRRLGAGILAWLSMPMLMVLAAFGFYLYDTSRPVVMEFRVLTQFVAEKEVIVSGTMNKVRDCELLELVARTTQLNVVGIDFLERHRGLTYSRPVGPQKFGPWSIQAKQGDGVTIYGRRRCNPLWTVSGELGSFVVGQQ